MKKYTLYIVIIIMLVGLFSPVARVHAETYDECYTREVSIDENSQRALDKCNNIATGGTSSPSTPASSSGFGCQLGTNPKFQDLLVYVSCIINHSVIPLIFALAVVMFIWGVVQYVINSSEEAKKEKGKQFMIWGIIALTVMVSVWGLVKIVGNTFGIEYVIPQVKSVKP